MIDPQQQGPLATSTASPQPQSQQQTKEPKKRLRFRNFIFLHVFLLLAASFIFSQVSRYHQVMSFQPGSIFFAPLYAAGVAAQTQEPFVRLPATGGVVHYSTSKYNGWNNQRESAMLAWVIAYLTGHAFQWKPFHPANTGVVSDQGHLAHGDLWNATRLKQYVHVQQIPCTQLGVDYQVQVELDQVFATPQELIRYTHNATSVSIRESWAVPQHQFPFVDPYDVTNGGSLIFRRMMESFVYASSIQEKADQVVEALNGTFWVLHIRQGREPAVDCPELNLNVIHEPGNVNKYRNGGCLGMGWPNVLDGRLFPRTDNTTIIPVYVAHDGSRAGQNFMKSSFPGFVLKQAADFQVLKNLRPALLSAVEQVVATRAEYFVASTHSSWSEYVIYQRVLSDQKDARRNYQVWVKNLDELHERPSMVKQISRTIKKALKPN